MWGVTVDPNRNPPSGHTEQDSNNRGKRFIYTLKFTTQSDVLVHIPISFDEGFGPGTVPEERPPKEEGPQTELVSLSRDSRDPGEVRDE